MPGSMLRVLKYYQKLLDSFGSLGACNSKINESVDFKRLQEESEEVIAYVVTIT